MASGKICESFLHTPHNRALRHSKRDRSQSDWIEECKRETRNLKEVLYAKLGHTISLDEGFCTLWTTIAFPPWSLGPQSPAVARLHTLQVPVGFVRMDITDATVNDTSTDITRIWINAMRTDVLEIENQTQWIGRS